LTQPRPRLVGDEFANEIAAIQSHCFPNAWNADSVRRVLEMSGTQAMIMPAPKGAGAGTAVGFALIGMAADEAEILSIGVLPGWRRQGIASQLITGAIELADGLGATVMFLEVAASNSGAKELYGRHGFLVSGERSGYYTLPSGGREDAVCMRLNLAGA
jgi:ribosomal-protein-alanine N-acetyltransferase